MKMYLENSKGEKMNLIKKENILIVKEKFSKKDEIFQIISQVVSKSKKVKEESIIKELQKRELDGSTGIGDQIAIPHASIDIKEPELVIIRLENPME
jgi:mannitol/fructose-specific phosphotransferase system IIA component (Ntr-type)